MPRAIKFIALTLLLFCVSTAQAQHFEIAGGKKRVTVPFKMVRSMVVIQLKINNNGPYNFVLDTGVGLMLITDHSLLDSLKIINKRSIKIAGLGDRDYYQAVVAPSIQVDVAGKLFSQHVSAAILQEDFFGLSNYAGMPVHGLIGYEFFNKLAVKINFTDSILVAAKPGAMRIFRKAEKMPLSIEENKPYIYAGLVLANGNKQPKKLLVDLGAGHPLSLEKIGQLPEKRIPANLGVGLNGLIDGHLGRINALSLGKFSIKNVITSFPKDDAFLKTGVQRDGSIGMGTLKRFDVIFDYQKEMMYLKPNNNFNAIFDHDMSGLSYHAAGKNFDRLIIEKVDKGSAAEEADLQPHDEILAINFKPVDKMTLQQIDDMLKSKDGRSLLLHVSRNNVHTRIMITLKRRI